MHVMVQRKRNFAILNILNILFIKQKAIRNVLINKQCFRWIYNCKVDWKILLLNFIITS